MNTAAGRSPSTKRARAKNEAAEAGVAMEEVVAGVGAVVSAAEEAVEADAADLAVGAAADASAADASATKAPVQNPKIQAPLPIPARVAFFGSECERAMTK